MSLESSLLEGLEKDDVDLLEGYLISSGVKTEKGLESYRSIFGSLLEHYHADKNSGYKISYSTAEFIWKAFDYDREASFFDNLLDNYLSNKTFLGNCVSMTALYTLLLSQDEDIKVNIMANHEHVFNIVSDQDQVYLVEASEKEDYWRWDSLSSDLRHQLKKEYSLIEPVKMMALFYNETGLKAYGKKDYTKAEDEFKKAMLVDSEGKLPFLRYHKGISELYQERFQDAMVSFDKAENLGFRHEDLNMCKEFCLERT